MPSLILENTDKNDDRRKDEAVDWIAKLESCFEIEKRKYIGNLSSAFREIKNARP